MTRRIDYHFAGASPFTYLGHDALLALAEKHGAEIAYRPVDIFGIWEVSGAVPPAKRPEVRQKYRLIELQRIALMRDKPINLKPKHFPVDTSLADCCVIALANHHKDAGAFLGSVLRGVWVDEANMADEAQIADRLAQVDVDPDTILNEAKSDAVQTVRQENTQAAIAAGAVGVPAYVLDGEVFWGQDRIEALAHALESGRDPIIAV